MGRCAAALEIQRRRRPLALGVGPFIFLAATAGCTSTPKWLRAPGPPAPEPTETAPRAEASRPAPPSLVLERERQRAVPLRMLVIQTPRAARERVGKIWSHLSTTGITAPMALQLERNGLRAAIGDEAGWTPVRAAFDAIEGSVVLAPPPYQAPPQVPIQLTLDDQARNYTLFTVDHEGGLHGETFRNAESVLDVTYQRDPRRPDAVMITVTPLVRVATGEQRLVASPLGPQVRRRDRGRAAEAAQLRVTLGAGEFLLLAPSETAELSGLIGDVFLVRRTDAPRDYHIVIAPGLDE